MTRANSTAIKKYLAENLLLVFLLSGPCVAAGGKALDTETFAFNWQFHRGDIELAEAEPYPWRKVQIPHDWPIESPPGESPSFATFEDACDTRRLLKND